MGITNNSLERLNNFGLLNPKQPYRMLELGCQNIYGDAFGTTYGMIAKEYFKGKQIEHISWDITACQCALKIDLRKKIDVKKHGQFDVITDYGTTEHVENTDDGGFYEAFKNIHNLCKLGGYMIHETPLTGHWIGHGFNYVTQEFYKKLAEDMGYQILDMKEHFAMGNTIDGGLLCCVLVKNKECDFVSKSRFQTYDFRKS